MINCLDAPTRGFFLEMEGFTKRPDIFIGKTIKN
jgi:hypothetical protein